MPRGDGEASLPVRGSGKRLRKMGFDQALGWEAVEAGGPGLVTPVTGWKLRY